MSVTAHHTVPPCLNKTPYSLSGSIALPTPREECETTRRHTAGLSAVCLLQISRQKDHCSSPLWRAQASKLALSVRVYALTLAPQGLIPERSKISPNSGFALKGGLLVRLSAVSGPTTDAMNEYVACAQLRRCLQVPLRGRGCKSYHTDQ